MSDLHLNNLFPVLANEQRRAGQRQRETAELARRAEELMKVKEDVTAPYAERVEAVAGLIQVRRALEGINENQKKQRGTE